MSNVIANFPAGILVSAIDDPNAPLRAIPVMNEDCVAARRAITDPQKSTSNAAIEVPIRSIM